MDTKYTESQKNEDFSYFKSINVDTYSKNGHCFLGIRNRDIVDFDKDITALISKMDNKGYHIGEYLLQECTGTDSDLTNVVMRLVINA